MFDSDRNTPIELPLYRIADEVLKEIVKAIYFWNDFSPSKNQLLINRAVTNLSTSYGTTKTIVSDTTNVQLDDVLTAKIKNGINAFKDYLNAKLNNSKTPEEKRIIQDLIETFKVAIENELRNV